VTGRLNIDLCGAVAPRKGLRGRQTIFSHVKLHQRAGQVVHGPFARRGPLARCYQQGADQDRFHQHDAPLSGREDNLGHRQQVPLQSPKGFFSRASAGVSSLRAKYPPKPEDAQIGKRLGLEKIKTIGDAYMVVAGVPEPRADHVQAATEMALAMQMHVEAISSRHPDLRLRIGIHSGSTRPG